MLELEAEGGSSRQKKQKIEAWGNGEALSTAGALQTTLKGSGFGLGHWESRWKGNGLIRSEFKKTLSSHHRTI